MRVKANYTFDENIKKEFDKICKEKSINKSDLLEKFIITFVMKSKEGK